MPGFTSLFLGHRRSPLPGWMNELGFILALTAIFSFLGATLFWLTQPKVDFGESLYWALVTMTTVGYGDFTPSNTEGRVVAVGLMIAGVSILGLVSASIASTLVARRLKEGKGMAKVNLKGHLLITGWSKRGELILHNLNISAPDYLREIVLVNELGENAVGSLQIKFQNLHISYVHGDPTNDFVLARAGVKRAAVAIVLSSTSADGATEETADNRTIKVVMGLRAFSTELKLFAEVRHVHNEPHLRRAGVDEIISSAEIGATLLANAPLSPGLPGMLRELLSFKGNGFRTVRIPDQFVGRPVADLFAYYRQDNSILVGVVTEFKSLDLTELIENRPESFVDAFIKHQFEHAARSDLESRSRFSVLVNPDDGYLVQAEELAMIISRQTPAESE